jgi:transglutaminase-like putative cysteine protease
MRARDVFSTIADPSGQGGGTGSAGLSPLLTLRNALHGKPQKVLSYTTNAEDPRAQYFQVYVVNYSGRQNSWLPPSFKDSKSVGGDKLPFAPQGQPTTSVSKVTTKVTVSSDYAGSPDLPLPYAPYQLQADGAPGWRETAGTLMVYNHPGMALAGVHYTVQSEEVNPPPSQIKDLQATGSIQAQYSTYGGPDYRQLYTIASKHTRGALSNLQIAFRLQNWFRSRAFTYSLNPNLPQTGNWLLPFLTSVHSGFCVQFAQAFAILARVLGIPARIAIGYTAGTQGPGGIWQITTADAHAWPELYFPGYGWLRFEPTPGGAGGQGTAVIPPYAASQTSSNNAGGTSSQGGSTGGSTGGAGGQAGKKPANRNTSTGCSATQPGRPVIPCTAGAAAAIKGSGSKLGLAIGIPVAVFLLIAWPALTRLLTRRRRWLSASGDAATAHAAWSELIDDLADYGLACAPGETPRAVARRVTRHVGLDETASSAVSRLAAAEERARYARLPDPGAGLKAAEVTVRRAVAASVPRQQRLRARLLPASTVLAARQLLQRGSEMLSWLDSSWPALGRQLRRAATRHAE